MYHFQFLQFRLCICAAGRYFNVTRMDRLSDVYIIEIVRATTCFDYIEMQTKRWMNLHGYYCLPTNA